jgi:excisionase family DNA binding protein
MKKKQYLNVKEAAENLTVEVSTIRSWIFQGKIPVKRIGRCVRIEDSIIEKILDSGLESLGS